MVIYGLLVAIGGVVTPILGLLPSHSIDITGVTQWIQGVSSEIAVVLPVSIWLQAVSWLVQLAIVLLPVALFLWVWRVAKP